MEGKKKGQSYIKSGMDGYGREKKNSPSSRIRTSDLWISMGFHIPLQSTALPTELSKELRLYNRRFGFYSINPYIILLQIFSSFFRSHALGLLKKCLQESVFYVEQIKAW